MRIVQPSVELMAVTVSIKQLRELLEDCVNRGTIPEWFLPSCEVLIETAGRTCYKSERVKCRKCGGEGKYQKVLYNNPSIVGPEETCSECHGEGYIERDINVGTASNFIKKILERGHESVIEHANATVRIVTDRGVTHELVRHRLASYSQESTRYCNYSKDKYGNQISVIRPPFEFGGHNTASVLAQETPWRRAMLSAEKEYFEMIAAGSSPQIARSVLPNSTKTEIVTTFNLREWRHFLRLRMSKAAHPQIRQIGGLCYRLMTRVAPTCFSGEFPELSKVVDIDLFDSVDRVDGGDELRLQITRVG